MAIWANQTTETDQIAVQLAEGYTATGESDDWMYGARWARVLVAGAAALCHKSGGRSDSLPEFMDFWG